MKKLEIGYRTKKDGWTTLDCAGDPDIVAQLPNLPDEVLSGNWDVIMAIHVFEHLHLREAKEFLRQTLSALKRGGKLILEMPNIEFAAKVLLGLEKEDRGIFGMRAFYGEASRDKPEMLHRWGWSPATLTYEMEIAGFTDVRVEPAKYHYPKRDFRIVGVR